jgi:vesicle-associated membrane protein 7
MAATSFQYALVARGVSPLAEYSVVTGNVRTIAVKMLENLDPKKPRGILEQSNGVFHSLADPDRITYMCLANKGISASVATKFLDDLKSRWRGRYGNSGLSFAPNSKNAEFGSTEIAQLFRNYNSQTAQKLNEIHRTLDDTQALRTQTLTMALIRDEQLTVMEGKAEDIRASAESFRRVAEKVKCQMCVQKWRWIVLGIIIGLVVIFIIVWICCGARFEKCGNTRKEGGN